MASFSAAALEGDYCENLLEIAKACGRRPVGQVLHFSSWPEVAPLAESPNHLAAALSGGWTVLIDDHYVTAHLFDNPVIGATFAARYGTRFVSAFAYSVTGWCGYRVHTPTGTRSVMLDEFGIVENEGDPLPGEDTSDIDKHEMYSILDLLGTLGLDVGEGVEASTKCAVVRLAAKRIRRSEK